MNKEIERIKSEVAEIASNAFTGKSIEQRVNEAFDLRGYYCVSKDIRTGGHIFVYDHDADEWFCLEKKLDYFVKLNAEVSKIIEGK